MIVRTTLDGVPVTASVTDRGITISRDDEFIAAWDLGGRLYSVVDGAHTWRRGLNGRMLEKWREDGARRRRWASDEAAAAVIDRASSLARDVLQTAVLRTGALRTVGRDPGPADRGLGGPPHVGPETVLSRAADFDSRAAAADASAFAKIYRPIGILPPDQYLALVLQATEGCSFRSCTFCEFYRDPYRVRNAAQFAAHLADVRGYLGDSLSLRDRAIFLGSANALAVPMSGLVPIFDLLARELAGRPVNAFLDGFTGTLKAADEYRSLAARGLHRVYIGLESGHDPLLEFVQKPSTRAQAVDAVRAIKAGGVRVGVIVMAGLGGARFADEHVRDTADALNAMELAAGDLLYFSELVAHPGSPYVEAADGAGIRPLTPAECTEQRRAIESQLTFRSSRPKIATYDVREFVY